jgi:MFS family permease
MTPSSVQRLPRVFWWHAAFTATTTAGATTFGVLSFHLVDQRLVAVALVPVLYAAAMGVDAIAALINGWSYDRYGPRSLAALPVLSALAVLGFSTSTPLAVTGVLLWAAALGIQESTLRAFVADTVPRDRRATAYGLYAGILGLATLVGGALTALLYAHSVRVLVIAELLLQLVALGVLAGVLSERSHHRSARSRGRGGHGPENR